MKDKEQFLASEADNNREEEKKISAIERTTAKLKQELQDAERLRDTFNSDVSRTDRWTDGRTDHSTLRDTFNSDVSTEYSAQPYFGKFCRMIQRQGACLSQQTLAVFVAV